MSVHVRVKSGHYYLDIYHQGKRRWESLHLSVSTDPQQNKETKRLAEIIRSQKEQQLVSGDWNLLDPIEGKRTLVSYAEELAEGQSAKNPLPKSLSYLRLYAKGILVGSVTERWVDGYRAFLLEREEIGPATAAKYLSALGYVLKHATRDRIIPHNPAEGVKGISVPEPMKVYLTPTEIGQLASKPIGGDLGAEVRNAFLFATYTGLRVSDLRSLQWGDVGREPLQLHKRQQKTKRIVDIPLHEAAWKIIDDGTIHRRDEPVFPLLAATNTNTNQYLKAWARQAGVDKPIGWHTARHTFAVLTLEGGADFYTVSKLLGHTKPQTTAVYAKATDGMKRKAIGGLPDFLA